MGLKDKTLIQNIKEKTFEGSQKFDVSYLSFTFGLKDDLYYHAKLIDITTGKEQRAVIHANESKDELLQKLVMIQDSDLCLFDRHQMTCCDYLEKNKSLKWL